MKLHSRTEDLLLRFAIIAYGLLGIITIEYSPATTVVVLAFMTYLTVKYAP